MKTTRISALLLVLFIIIPAAVYAQTGGGQQSPGGTPSPAAVQAIKLNAPFTVHLSGTTPVSLSYKTSGNETVSITARSLEAEDVVDPNLVVLDASGATLASNDDHRTNRTDLAPHDSLIANLTLTDPGRYIIQVAAASDDEVGDVEVLVTTSSGDNSQSEVPAAETPAAEAPSNQTIDDSVPNTGPYTTTIQATSGEVLTITVKSTDNQLDPKVALIDSSGAVVASNDDHESNDPTLGPYDSQIPDFTIPKTDTYTIQITGFAQIGGKFELTISQGNGGSPEATTLPTQEANSSTQESSQGTQVIAGTVNANQTYSYTLQANAGDVYTITVQAKTTNFDPRVSIYLNNDYVADNDDYGSSDPTLQKTDARIYDQIFTTSGAYEIDVRGYEDSSGDFTMTIDHVATGAPTGLPTEQVLLGTVKSGDTYNTTFDARAGDWVTITARALTTNFDPYVSLLSADGTVLLDNDNSGSSSGLLSFYDAQITNYHIPADGTYTVEVSGSDSNGGSFGLTIGTLR